MIWQIFLTEEAKQRLLAIKDRRIRKLLYARAMKLQESPKQQGKYSACVEKLQKTSVCKCLTVLQAAVSI